MFRAIFRRLFCRAARGLALLVLVCLAVTGQAQLATSGWPIAGGNQFQTNVSTGADAVPAIKWSVACTGVNPVIGIHGEVYLADAAAPYNIYALDPKTGATLRTFNSGTALPWALAVGADGTLYASQILANSGALEPPTGGLYALNGAMGAVLWSNTTTGFTPPILGGPGGHLYCCSAWLNSGGYYTYTLLGVDPATGNTLWSDPDIAYYTAPTGPSIGADGTLYLFGDVGLGANQDNALDAINGQTGGLDWQTDSVNGLGAPIVDVGGSIEFQSGASSSWTYLKIANSSGALGWSITLGSEGYEPVAVDATGNTYIYENALKVDGVVAYAPGDSTPLWTSPVTSPYGTESLVLDANDLLYALQVNPDDPGGAALAALDTSTGQTFWTLTLPTDFHPIGCAMAADGTMYSGDGATVVAIDSAHATALSVSPSTALGGVSSTGTLTLSRGAPPQGGTYQITSSETSAVSSLSVQVPAGQTSASFSVPTVPVSTQTAVTLTATPGNATATLTVNPPSLVSVALNPTAVFGGNTSTGTVTISSAAPSGGLPIALECSSPAASVPASVTVPSGATSVSFAVTTTGVDLQTTAVITASLNQAVQSARLTVNPAALASLSLNPTSVQGGTSSTGTLTLNGVPGPSGVSISLSSGNSAATVPSSVSLAAGKPSATFTVTTIGVNSQTNVLITGTLSGESESATLTITPATLSSLVLSPSTLQGGGSSTGAVTLSGPAGSGGTSVALASSSTSAQVPSSVTVPAGQTTATFTLNTTGVNTQSLVTVTASLNGKSQKATLTINPPVLVSVSLNPTSVPGGTSSTGTVTLSSPAAPSGTSVSLSSGNAAAQVPSSVTVPSGQTTASFIVTTTGVNAQTSAVVTGTFNGKSQTASLTIAAPTLTSLTLTPTKLQGGAPSSAALTLSALAGPGGLVVTVSSSSSSATVPASITVPYGQKTASFTVSTVPVSAVTNATVTANANGSTAQATLSIGEAAIASLALNPASVAGPASSTGTVSLSGPAGPGGITVSLSSSSSDASVPGSVTIPAGQSGTTFTVSAQAVTATTTATITASFAGVSKTATLTMVPVALMSLSFAPDSVTGGSDSTGTATLNGLAPKGGLVVKLTSGATTVKVPASVTILAGKLSASFTATTTAVAAQKTVTVTAKLAAVSQTATLTLNPPVLVSLSMKPSSVVGGTSSTGTVTLSGAAPAGGISVNLSSGSSSATVPSSVKVAGGSKTGAFTAKTVAVTTNASVTLTGSLNGSSQTTTLTIQAPTLKSLTLSPASVTGGKSSTGTVTISSAAPSGGLVISLSSSASSATAPGTVTISAGKTSGTFTVKTTAVSSKTTATIAATLAGVSKAATLMVLP